jgi:PhzF family phenazine biosynthesis protein
MLNLPLYQVDAFTETLFGGNPPPWFRCRFPPDSLMQKIAAENNLSETAFVAIRGRGKFNIRWFTPASEVRLCGHATLASAHILYQSGDKNLKTMRFKTEEAGTIVVRPHGNGRYSLDFSAEVPKPIRSPKGLRGILGGHQARSRLRGNGRRFGTAKNQKQLEKLTPNFPMLVALKKYRGLIATAPGRSMIL